MPGHSGSWEGSMPLAVHPWTSPPISLGLSASSCSLCQDPEGLSPVGMDPTIMEDGLE